MNRGGLSRYVPIILFVVIVVIIIAAFISIGRSIFGGDDEPTNDPGRTSLTSTGVDRSVRMTARGRIVAQENFRSYEITVSPDERKLVTYQGYLETPLETHEFGNNSRAYEEFVYALARYDMMNGQEASGEDDDTRGRCPDGSLYEFETINAGGVVKRLWTTTCRGDEGTLDTKYRPLRDLFTDQIPDSRKAISPLRIR